MRAKFTQENNYVTVEYDDDYSGERTQRTFYVPHSGGYVREYPSDKQICEGLGYRGPTLQSSPENLLKTIRLHWGKQ